MAAAGAELPSALLLLAAATAGLGAFIWKPLRPAAFLVFFGIAAGGFYYHFYFSARAAHISVPLGEKTSFSGFVSAEPGHGAKSEYFPLKLSPPYRGTIRVFAPPGSGFRYGDELRLAGIIEAPESERDLPAAFFPKIERTGTEGGWAFRRALFGFKARMTGALPRYLPATEAAFMGDITLGEKADFSPEFIAALAASGTTHLVALSGYNIAILVLVVFGGLLSFLGRRAAFWITSAAIFLFVLMVGAEPSVVRAAAMGFLALLSREIGRPYGLPFALLWTAFLMVLFDPAALFMPGFQLSFMALLGIVHLSPVILRWLGGGSGDGPLTAPLAGFREHAALTIAAQLAVLPIALNNFGSVSAMSILANVLILPFMPITMLCGFVLIACGLLFPPSGILAGWAAHALLAYEVGVIRFFAAFQLPVSGTLPWSGILLYYSALVLLVRRYEMREKKANGGI